MTLYQLFGIKYGKYNVIICIQKCFRIDHVIIFCPMVDFQQQISEVCRQRVFAHCKMHRMSGKHGPKSSAKSGSKSQKGNLVLC